MAFASRNKRSVRALLFAVILTVLYFGIFPYPLGREIIAVPQWSLALPDAAAAQPAPSAAETKGAAAPFRLGEVFGYVDARGTVLHEEKALFGVTQGEAGFVSFTRLATDWILEDPRGNRVLSFSGDGYPLVSPNGLRLFNVKSDLTGLRELDDSAETAWERDFPSLMTSVSLQRDFLLVGLLNGTCVLLNRAGSAVFQFSPPGSRLPVALGAAVSPNGELLAAATGVDPQLLTVMRKRGATYGNLARVLLGSDFRREMRMAFSPDSRFLLVEGNRAAVLFDPGRQRTEWVALRGSLSGVSFPGKGRYAAVAARDGPLVDLQIVAPFDRVILRESFAARELSMGAVDGELLLGVDGRLLRIDVGEM